MVFDLDAFMKDASPSNAVTTERYSFDGGLEFTRRDLDDGTIKDTGIPSRRQNKNKSGRRGRKQYQGSKWLSAVGGTTDLIGASYGMEGIEMCHTVDSRRGWKSDGTPNRL